MFESPCKCRNPLSEFEALRFSVELQSTLHTPYQGVQSKESPQVGTWLNHTEQVPTFTEELRPVSQDP
jgi:hypothetical protein